MLLGLNQGFMCDKQTLHNPAPKHEFLLLFFKWCVCVLCIGSCVEVRGQPVGVSLSFYQVDSWVRLGGKHLCQLSHLLGPKHEIF